MIATLLESPSVEAAIDWIICHPDQFGKTSAKASTPSVKPSTQTPKAAAKSPAASGGSGMARAKSTPMERTKSPPAKSPVTGGANKKTPGSSAKKDGISRVKSESVGAKHSSLLDDMSGLNMSVTRDISVDSPSVGTPEAEDIFAVGVSEHDGKECVNLVFVGGLCG